MGEVRGGFVECGDAAVDDDCKAGVGVLEAIDTAVVERWDLAVFLGRQSLQPGLASVYDEHLAAGAGDSPHEAFEVGLAVLIVDADPAFDSDGNGNRGPHRCDARSNEVGLRHQARAEVAALDAIRRTSDIEIDFIIAKVCSDPSGFGKFRRIAATQL